MTQEKQIKIIEKQEGKKIDLTPYIGKKAKIAQVEIRESKYGHALYVATEIIDTVKVTDEKQIELKATKMFGIGNDDEGNLFAIKESKLDTFLSEFKLDLPEYKKLLGKVVIIQLTEKKDFLTF